MISGQDIAESVDPRIRRTRQLLHDALVRLMAEKDFDRISIGDIAEAATLNRATFYAHFADKFALLNSVVDTRFRELIARRGITFNNCEGALRSIALVVCDYLAETPGASACSTRPLQRYLEAAIVEVIRCMILQGFEHHPEPSAFPPALIASTVAWAIYGASQEWMRTPRRPPAEHMAVTIDALVSPIFKAKPLA